MRPWCVVALLSVTVFRGVTASAQGSPPPLPTTVTLEDVLKLLEAPDLPADTTVLGDPDELKAAVLNLIDNAVKYSGSHVAIEVELAALGDGRIAVRVRDHGIGISAPELKRIFRRFYRIPGAVALRVKGTGLGLFIVSSIARKHGGRVFAESEGPGHGSTFTLQLPRAPTA